MLAEVTLNLVQYIILVMCCNKKNNLKTLAKKPVISFFISVLYMFFYQDWYILVLNFFPDK